MTRDYQPKIVGFFCTWCSYPGADMAGTSHTEVPASIRIIRVLCSGRVDPTFVLKAFAEGADGVIVSGCHLGECHYVSGNVKAMRRMPVVARCLEDYGIDPRRLRSTWISASEPEHFAAVVKDMTEMLRELGPLAHPNRLTSWSGSRASLEQTRTSP